MHFLDLRSSLRFKFNTPPTHTHTIALQHNSLIALQHTQRWVIQPPVHALREFCFSTNMAKVTWQYRVRYLIQYRFFKQKHYSKGLDIHREVALLPFGTSRLFSPCIKSLGCVTMYCYMVDHHISHPDYDIYFITIVLTPRNILSDNNNLLILYIKYVLKILTPRKYKKLSKGRILSVNMPQSGRNKAEKAPNIDYL